MQNAGSLKKKRKRCLNKVNGTGTRPINTKHDNFNINDIYDSEQKLHRQVEINKEDERLEIILHPLPSANGSTTDSRIPNNIHGLHRFLPTLHDEEFITRGNSLTESPTHGPGILFFAQKNRPCFLSEKATRRLRHICIVGALVWALPWTFSVKEQRIHRWTIAVHRIWQIFWFIFFIQNAILLQYQFYAFMTKTQLDHGSYRPLFMNIFSVFWYLYSITLNTMMHLYREKFRVYINALLDMNRQYVDRFVLHLEDVDEQGQAVLRWTIPCNFIQLGLSVMFFLKYPFQPWYTYSYIYKVDNPWYWLIPGAIQEWIMAGQTVAVFCLVGWMVVCHGNSVNFWLQECHNNFESGNTMDEIREPQNCIMIYKTTQVLTGLLNDCISPLAYPLMKLAAWTATISCGYVLIRSMNQKMIDEFPVILTYPFGFIVCSTCPFGMLQVSAQMNDLATSFLDSWSKTKNKNLRRVLASFRTLRLNVGSFYYVTTSTTITFFQKTYDYIIDLIIAFP